MSVRGERKNIVTMRSLDPEQVAYLFRQGIWKTIHLQYHHRKVSSQSDLTCLSSAVM